MKVNPTWWSMGLAAMLCLAACDDGVLYHRYQSVSQQGWERADTLCFDLPEAPDDGRYTLEIGLRCSNLFPYQGLWVVAETRLQPTGSLHRDTLYLAVTDEDGRPQGHGINLMQREQSFATLHLSQGQQATIRLRHIMRREVVPHITDVGIRVCKPSPKAR